jgi:hypothetical protein
MWGGGRASARRPAFLVGDGVTRRRIAATVDEV